MSVTDLHSILRAVDLVNTSSRKSARVVARRLWISLLQAASCPLSSFVPFFPLLISIYKYNLQFTNTVNFPNSFAGCVRLTVIVKQAAKMVTAALLTSFSFFIPGYFGALLLRRLGRGDDDAADILMRRINRDRIVFYNELMSPWLICVNA